MRNICIRFKYPRGAIPPLSSILAAPLLVVLGQVLVAQTAYIEAVHRGLVWGSGTKTSIGRGMGYHTNLPCRRSTAISGYIHIIYHYTLNDNIKRLTDSGTCMNYVYIHQLMNTPSYYYLIHRMYVDHSPPD